MSASAIMISSHRRCPLDVHAAHGRRISQNDLVFVGAVAADSEEPYAAKAFITYLKTPQAAAVFRVKGVRPG
jgi:hypothetical protein